MADLQELIEAVSSPTRREILNLVWDRSRTVGEIAAHFELRSPTISQHLKVLRAAGLVTRVVDGNFRRYRADHRTVQALRTALPDSPDRWMPADDIPEIHHAASETLRVVRTAVDVDVDPATTFAAFTDAEIYSRWLGVPVSIVEDQFSCTLEWGTRIRGRYEVVAAPDLIALAWDFEDDNIPVPGGELIGYMRFTPVGAGCRVEVHQLCPDQAAAEFMEVAWAMVLGRLHEGVAAAIAGQGEPVRRPPRRKRIVTD